MMWLVSRFSFSLLALGIVLMYLALVDDGRAARPAWQGPAMIAGGVACAMLGLAGIRHRHRGS